jgi:polyisoprenoid-binding protein YceI
MKLMKLGLASLVVSSALFAGNYNVDVAHSNVGFTVKHMMITNVTGKFNDVVGTFEYDEKTNKLKSIEGEIIVASINTANEKRDNHLKADDMFNAEKFPKITFKSTKVEDDAVYGDFTMKGITKNIKLDLENGGVMADKAGFALSGKIKRSEFDLTWNKALETGGVAVSDEVKLVIDVQGKLAN